MLMFRTNSESSQASEVEFCVIKITHFSRLLFWLLVQIWKFDWFRNMLLLTVITENIKNKNCLILIVYKICKRAIFNCKDVSIILPI